MIILNGLKHFFLKGQSLDIILPCFNPADGWEEGIIHSYNEIISQIPFTEIHILVVNDGSVRGITEEKIARLKNSIPNFRMISYSRNQGKGYALRTGVNRSKSALCIFTDVDFPFWEKDIVAIYNELASGSSDIVAGVRDESYYTKLPKARIRISKFLKFFSRRLFLLPINDTQCGLKGFNVKGKEIFLKTRIRRYLFDLEFIFLAARNRNVRIATQLVQLKPGIKFSRMNFKILSKEGANFLKLLMRYYFKA